MTAYEASAGLINDAKPTAEEKAEVVCWNLPTKLHNFYVNQKLLLGT